MELLEEIAGFLIVGAVLWDVFQTVVVPRPSPGRFRIARNLTRLAWRLTRVLALRTSNAARREGMLGVFAPALVVILLVAWVVGLLVGFGLMVYGFRAELQPQPANIGEAIYAAGTALFTIGFGDFVPIASAARLISLVAAGTGLGIVALVITYLFSLYGAFQRREVQVVTLDSRAGAPPSGVALLETYARLDLVAELPDLFATWEGWAAEVLDSHVAYPILAYFRSSHDSESWVGSVGAVLDAATLVITTVEGVPRGHAELMAAMGEHLVEDVANLFGFQNEPGAGIARMEFAEARQRLAAAGYALADADRAWRSFQARRSHYAARLNRLAEFWVSPPSQWIGDRAPIGHHDEDDVELGGFAGPLLPAPAFAAAATAADGSSAAGAGSPLAANAVPLHDAGAPAADR